MDLNVIILLSPVCFYLFLISGTVYQMLYSKHFKYTVQKECDIIMGDKSEGGHVILISYGRNNLLFIVFYGNASDYLRPFAWLMSIYIHRLESPTFYTDNDEVSRCQGRLCVSVNPILSNPNII